MHSQRKYECAEMKAGLVQSIGYDPSQIKISQPFAPLNGNSDYTVLINCLCQHFVFGGYH